MDDIKTAEDVRNEKIQAIWARDRLNRAHEVENAHTILCVTNDPRVVVLDAKWGTGKTHFMQMWYDYAKLHGHTTVYINAWENDYIDDPLLPLLEGLTSSISLKEPKYRDAIDTIMKNGSKFIRSSLPVFLKIATYGLLDAEQVKNHRDFLSSASEALSANLIDAFKNEKTAMEATKEALKRLYDPETPTLIFIDELDRCDPRFTLKLMERIKHMFDEGNVKFILAMSVEEFSKVLCKTYGNIEVDDYLNKIVDYKFSLPRPNYFEYTNLAFSAEDLKEKIIAEVGYVNLVKVFALIAMTQNLSLRDIERAAYLFRIIIQVSPINASFNYPALFMILVSKIKGDAIYSDFQNGNLKLDNLKKYLQNPGNPHNHQYYHAILSAGMYAIYSESDLDPHLNVFRARANDGQDREKAEWNRSILDWICVFKSASNLDELRNRLNIINYIV